MSPGSTVIVRGTGDVGSAVAHVLRSDGYRVLLHDAPRPPHSRRGMSFVDALYEGVALLEGITAKHAPTVSDLPYMIECGRAVPVADTGFAQLMTLMQPEVLVDARMRKRLTPESQRQLAPLTIGLGPNFEAGTNVHVAIETAWGENLGAVLRSGRTEDLAGEPREIAGHARDRYVYAAAAGVFKTRRAIGDIVARGECLACIGEVPVLAPLDGCLRGLTHDGAHVWRGTKIIEIDPRGVASGAFGLGERPRAIAAGVLRAIRSSA